MLRTFVILLVSVSVWGNPVPEERSESMTNFAGQMVKSMAGNAAKSMTEGLIDQAVNMFGMAQSAGKNILSTISKPDQDDESQMVHHEYNSPIQEQQKYGYKVRRSEDPLVDALLRKRIENTFQDIDQVLAPLRNARDEGSGASSAVFSVISTIIGLLKNIPQLAPLIDTIRPFLAAVGINV